MTGTTSSHQVIHDDRHRPAVAYELAMAAGQGERLAPAHGARLLVATAGSVAVSSDEGAFSVAEERGLWLPAGQAFDILARTAAQLCVVAIERPGPAMPRGGCLVNLSPLVRALAVEIGVAGSQRCGKRAAPLMALLMEKLAEAPMVLEYVTLPRDPRLRRVCEAIIARPADDRGIDAWSREAGMARRTFTQSFRDETGMAFARWRRQLRLAEAAQRLAAGQPIGRVAHDLGYDSSSAFSAMFRRTLGMPPRVYLRRA